MFNSRFIRRQLTSSTQQSAIFVLCVALSMASLVSLRGFGDSINRALLADAKELQAADIIVESNFALSEPTTAQIAEMVDAGQVERAQLYEFYTVVRLPDREDTLLSNIKAVGSGYPFYGEVTLDSGRPLRTRSHRALSSWSRCCWTGWASPWGMNWTSAPSP